MTQRVRDASRPLRVRMRELVPSPDNQTCECAGDYQCACCVIAEAVGVIDILLSRSTGEEDAKEFKL